MSGLEHRHLRSAIEFAVLMAAEGTKRKAGFDAPAPLKKYFNATRIPNGALGPLRRAIEADSTFRSLLAAGAVPELVDEIGRLWLQRPENWEADALALAARAEIAAEDRGAAVQLRTAERRRAAAEQAAARTRIELAQRDERIDKQTTEIDTLRAEVAKAEDVAEERRIELVDVRVEVRHARDREAAARARLEATEQQLAAARAEAERLSAVEAAHEPSPPVPSVDHTELAEAVADARELAARLESLLGSPPASRVGSQDAGPVGSPAPTERAARPQRRRALALPGGVIASSAEAAEYLVRTDAHVLVDGYNVAMLGWPNRPLERQRTALLDALENLARRFGTDCTVVFDGADVVGAHTARRRLVRVVYSSAGVTADDVIRDETNRLPTSRPVVVVTNDAEIVRDVRAAGANVVPSNALLALF